MQRFSTILPHNAEGDSKNGKILDQPNKLLKTNAFAACETNPCYPTGGLLAFTDHYKFITDEGETSQVG